MKHFAVLLKESVAQPILKCFIRPANVLPSSSDSLAALHAAPYAALSSSLTEPCGGWFFTLDSLRRRRCRPEPASEASASAGDAGSEPATARARLSVASGSRRRRPRRRRA